jgi:hypothetical protein
MPTFSQIKEATTCGVVAIGLTASMGGFLFGSDTGQVSGYIIMDVRFVETGPSEACCSSELTKRCRISSTDFQRIMVVIMNGVLFD